MGSSGRAVPGTMSGKPLRAAIHRRISEPRLTPTGIILARPFLCPILLSCDVHGTRVRVSTMVDTDENGPLESTGSITATRSYFLL